MERYKERNKDGNRDGQAKCRRCGKYWPVGDFTIEPNSKMPMCSVCLKDVGEGSPIVIKKKEDIAVERIDQEKVRKRCPNCNYRYNYNKLERTPTRCPYCNVKLKQI